MILVTGPSDLAGDASLTSLHAPGSGRLVVSAPIDSVAAGAAMRALLRAMGKRPSVAPVWERTADELPWAHIWLEAFRVRIVMLP